MISCIKLMGEIKEKMNEPLVSSEVIDTKTRLNDIPRKIYPGMVSMRGSNVNKKFKPKMESSAQHKLETQEKPRGETDDKSSIKSSKGCGLKRPSSLSYDSCESSEPETPDVVITSVHIPKRSRISDSSDGRSSSSESFPSPIVVKPVDDRADKLMQDKCSTDKMIIYQSSPNPQSFTPQVIEAEDMVKIFNSLTNNTNNTTKFNSGYGKVKPFIANVFQKNLKSQMSNHQMFRTNMSSGYIINKNASLRTDKDHLENNKRHPTRTGICYRQPYQQWQIDILAKEYFKSRYIRRDRKIELGNEINLSPYQIKVWFQNRRSKDQKPTHEVRMH